MKQQIRKGVFETNSSSTHSITITDKETYNDWTNGNKMYNMDSEKFLPTNEAIEWNIKNIFNDTGKLFVDQYRKTRSIHEAIEMCEDEGENVDFFEEELDLYEMYITYDEYEEWVGKRYEDYTKSYKTKNGDEIVAFGYYGND